MSDRVAQLLAVYADFTAAIAGIPDAKAQELQRLSARVPEFVAHARAAQGSEEQIARALEEGLDELLQLLAGVEAHWHAAVARALHHAIAWRCPEFADVQAQRLAAIVAAGEIRSDADLHLVRHRIAVLEGEPELSGQLQALYALVRCYGG